MTLDVSVRIHIRDRSAPEPPPPPPARPALWMHKEDVDIRDSSWGGGVRPCAPCPAVWVLKDSPHAIMTQQWQYYIRAINYNMSVSDCQFLLEDQRAFANGTGFKSRDTSGRADYFYNRDLGKELPRLDKVRTCSRSVLTGTVTYSLTTALKQTVTAVTDRASGKKTALAAKPLRQVLTASNVLRVTTLDSRLPPPLKAGRTYPNDISRVNPDDYLYMPQTHPWLFLVATITNARGGTVQFPYGALYPWFFDGKSPASFMPHVSDHSKGEILYPLSRLQPLHASDPIPFPYRYV